MLPTPYVRQRSKNKIIQLSDANPKISISKYFSFVEYMAWFIGIEGAFFLYTVCRLKTPEVLRSPVKPAAIAR